jgi:hypothetical protein
MVLIQLLLPTSGAQRADALASFGETRRELTERFDGLTAYLRSPASGWWTAPDGHTEQDDIVMVEVVAPTFERTWWRTYAATLAESFWPGDYPLACDADGVARRLKSAPGPKRSIKAAVTHVPVRYAWQ